MRTITQSKTAKIISAYLIFHRDGSLVSKIHTHFLTNCLQVDVYDRYNGLAYQKRLKCTDLTELIGRDAKNKGTEIDGVKIYNNNVPIDPEDKSLIKSRETTYYLSGLDRLKALGYTVIKVI